MRKIPFDPQLAKRLQKQYQMEKPPADLNELIDFARAQVIATDRGREWIASIRDGKMAIGETDADRGHSIVSQDGREVKVMCGYDALGTSLIRGEGLINATCFHCGEKMEIEIKGSELVRVSHPSILFWIGDGPKGIPICDHYNFFPGPKHLDGWLETNPEELGVALTLEEAIEFLTLSHEGL
ncbi:MAG: organomercurial lyase [Candidatus Thorarchaeota archaeon]